MRGLITLLAFISALFFPWPLTALLAIIAAMREPLVPLALGIFVDTLYYVPSALSLPLSTLLGALVTVLAFFVHSRLRTSPVRDL
ncbi:hypothetical protein A2950_02260 [Candidatus Kaiserbacteria bacterium RIFCSPLOWO2_01_FULL_55_19]|uniref:Uncharacterized protein n=1 Tax=Candidatus Kaiserbacteria bacterium RIFCSPLOWO2_01_FULL_55_19 TaxID=1798516 RepID=A0A1F6ES39_9BACT|nr:MAG: hypothetical protein A2950_02260 [Candidatus Kaiserbacteria bacterium RIFCSPLOWO2_01_FULL_55_19]